MNPSPAPRRLWLRAALAVVVLGLGVALWRGWRRSPAPPRPEERAPAEKTVAPAQPPEPRAATTPTPHAAGEKTTPGGLSPEKAAAVAKIKRDYDELRAKASADYTAAGPNFPGGLNAFLKQLALLEREMRKDLAAVLTPREFEDLELRETNAGQLVAKLLGDTAATDEQRREVFRLQRGYEMDVSLAFDLKPAALLARETERQRLQERVRGVLGDAVFAAWLRGEGPEFEQFEKFSAKQGLAGASAFDLWRAKNEFTRRRLELNAQPGASGPQRNAALAALIQDTETRVLGIVGAGAMPAAREQILGWLPKK